MERVSRCWSAAYTAFSRTKTVDIQLLHNTELKRCLDVVDLIALGQSQQLYSRPAITARYPMVAVVGPSSVVRVRSMVMSW